MTLIKQDEPKDLHGHKLLILAPWVPSEDFLQELRSKYSGLEIVYRELPRTRRVSEASIPPEEWKDVTILLAGGFAIPDKDLVPKLKYVQVTSAGANRILSHPLFLESDVTFCTANGVHGPQIAEWVIFTYLSFEHHFPKYLELQHEARWQRGAEPVEDSYKKRAGILGYGSIGRQVARLAVALGMEVYAYTLHPRPTEDSRRDTGYVPSGLGDPDGSFPSKWFSGSSTEELHHFLGSGLDLLVISAPLTDSTKHLIAGPELEILSEKKTFISNIGRGAIIKTEDLIDGLERGLVRGAALDVTDPEPLPDGHPLWRAKNIIITPHTSGASASNRTRVQEILGANLDRFVDGKQLINEVSRKEGY